MTDKTIDLDRRRGMGAQKPTDLRRLLAEVKANESALRLRQDELEALSLLKTISGICGAAPLASAFSDDSSQGTVQSYVRPVLRGLGPLASMRSAMRVAHQYFAL
jgi:hypothetical protein